ncbi:hypothetical protein ACSMXN_05245 [Jatrophihabitans sp. DSM 45814]
MLATRQSPGDVCPFELAVVVDVAERIHDRQLADALCRSVLGALRYRLTLAEVDAFTDFRRERTYEARAAEEGLWSLAAQQTTRKRASGMGIRLDPAIADEWELLCSYAGWSINVDLFDAEKADIGTFHDCGHSIVALLTIEEAGTGSGTDRLATGLNPVIHEHDPLTGVQMIAPRTEQKVAVPVVRWGTCHGRYWDKLYLMRNRIVHGGYLPNGGDAERADITFAEFAGFLDDRLMARARTNPKAVRWRFSRLDEVTHEDPGREDT